MGNQLGTDYIESKNHIVGDIGRSIFVDLDSHIVIPTDTTGIIFSIILASPNGAKSEYVGTYDADTRCILYQINSSSVLNAVGMWKRQGKIVAGNSVAYTSISSFKVIRRI